MLFDTSGDAGWYGVSLMIEDLDANDNPLSRISLSFLLNVSLDDSTCKSPRILEPTWKCRTIPVNQRHELTITAEAATADLP